MRESSINKIASAAEDESFTASRSAIFDGAPEGPAEALPTVPPFFNDKQKNFKDVFPEVRDNALVCTSCGHFGLAQSLHTRLFFIGL